MQNLTHKSLRPGSRRYEGVEELMKTYTGPSAFDNMISDLSKLNVKYLQQLLSDLKDGYINPFPGDYHRMLQQAVETNIMERTLLK